MKTAPANTSPPTIAGTPKKGKVLKGSPGTWAGSTPLTYSYRWQRCDAGGNNCLPLTTGPSYAVKAADIGSTIRVAVTAKNAAGSATATSDATASVTALQHG